MLFRGVSTGCEKSNTEERMFPKQLAALRDMRCSSALAKHAASNSNGPNGIVRMIVIVCLGFAEGWEWNHARAQPSIPPNAGMAVRRQKPGHSQARLRTEWALGECRIQRS